MKTKLLKKLRNKYSIVSKTVHVIKTLYSVKTLNSYKKNEPLDVVFGTYSFDEAKKKQRELILKHIGRWD